MPYLSRIWLNPLRRTTQRYYSDPQTVHAAVLGGIPDQPVTERILWRLDAIRAHRTALYVLTQSAPSWEHIVEQAGWPNTSHPQSSIKPYERITDRLATDQQYAFHLCANPVRTVPIATDDPPGKHPRGVRRAHRTAQQQIEWLLDHTKGWGWDIPVATSGDRDVTIIERRTVHFAKRSGNRVTLDTATFEGRLHVLDPDLLRHSLLVGVGPAKAYGCGLITLAPLY